MRKNEAFPPRLPARSGRCRRLARYRLPTFYRANRLGRRGCTVGPLPLICQPAIAEFDNGGPGEWVLRRRVPYSFGGWPVIERFESRFPERELKPSAHEWFDQYFGQVST